MRGMKFFDMSRGAWCVVVLAVVMAVVGAAPVGAQSLDASGRNSNVTLPGVTMTPAKTSELMDKGPACMDYKWSSSGICCKWCKICNPKCKIICCPRYEGTKHNISYWEPTEIIEVSCRTGYSMVAPGGVPSRLAQHVGGGGDAAKMPQSCVGFSKPGNQKWFFEARTWTINGFDGKLRHKAMGGVHGERARQCTLARGDDLPWPGLPAGNYWGYGVKWLQFSRGAATGPDGSWEGYISDSDPSWARETSGQAGSASLSACAPGTNDMQNCWGPVTENGWVTHSNPKVAAALVAWRAHTKALKNKKVSPAGKSAGSKNGFYMMMDYPYVGYAGQHGASMGMSNSGKTGSACFDPGDSGPAWYGGLTPGAIPSMVTGLTSGSIATAAEINPGVYIFTIWAHTSCTRYKFPAADPTPICHYRTSDPR